MGNPLTSNQHGYIKRALHAFETVAEALERIADSFETQSGASSKSNTEAKAHRTEIEPSGRYDELAIDGVEAQSVAIDHECNPPELIVHADDVRHPTPTDGEMPTHILELPAADTAESEH